MGKLRAYLNEGHIVDQVHDAINATDRHGILIAWNAAAERIYGYSAAEVLGQHVSLLFFPNDLGILEFDILAPLQTKDFHELTVRNRRKDGTQILVNLRLSVVRDRSGSVVRLIGCSNDITARKHTEDALLQQIADRTAIAQQLRISEARLQEAQRIAQIGSWDLNLIDNTLFWTDEVFNIFEVDKNVFGASYEAFLSAIHPEDRDYVDTIYRRSLEECKPYEVTHRLLFPDGRIKHVRERCVSFYADDGRPIRSVGTVQDITSYALAQWERNQSDERLRFVTEAVNDGIWDWNLSTHEVYVSPRWEEILGYTREDLLPVDSYFFDLIHPEDRLLIEEGLHQHFTENVPFSLEFRLRRKDGTYCWVHAHGKAIRDSSDGPARMVGAITDIDERKHADIALEDERTRLRQILDSQFGLVAELSTDGIIVDANQAPLTLMELKRADVIGRPFWDIGWLEPGTEPLVQGYIRRAAQGDVVRTDLLTLFPTIGLRYIDTVFSPLKDVNAKVVGVVGFGVDITDRKLAEIKLSESEARLNLVFNSTSDFHALIRVAPGSRFIVEAVNRSLIEALAEWIPAFAQNIIGQDVAEFLSAAGVFKERLALRLKTCQEVAEDQTPRHVDGIASGLPADVSIYPINDEEKRCTHLLIVAHNISDRQRAEAMQTSLREKETLLREVHHRVKNNLQIISSLLRFQSRKIVDPRDVEVFAQGQSRLQAMVLVHEQLYRSSSLSDIDFGDYVRSLAEQFAVSQGEAHDRIHLMVESPKITVPAEFAMPLGMVITELLSNAFKYAFPGPRTGSVMVRITHTKSAIAVSVEDDGIGAALETALENGAGFGLGLVRGLSQQLRGKLSYHKEGGTKIALEVPYEAHE